jgi:hypothetical protein
MSEADAAHTPRKRTGRMAEIDLRQLNSINWETSDMLAAAGVPLPRFKQWSLRGIDYSDNPSPGHGNRRTFPLFAAYFYAGIALLADESSMYIGDAKKKMEIIMFCQSFTGAKNYREAEMLYEDLSKWPKHMLNRDMKNPTMAFSATGKGVRFVWLSGGKGPIVTDNGTLYEMNLPGARGVHRPKTATVLNLTELLRSVDQILAARLALVA